MHSFYENAVVINRGGSNEKSTIVSVLVFGGGYGVD